MQIEDRPWMAFFSQSGQELHNIISFFNRKPDAIITNRQDDIGVFMPLLLEKEKGAVNWISLPKKPNVKDYKTALEKFNDPVITLHGYLRVIPEDICDSYEIYNLHPGLITEYPELKGKDPQERAIKSKYEKIGCVIHRVIPEIDCGEVIMANSIDTANLDEETQYNNLRALATVMWYDFFNNFKQYEHRRNRKNNRKTISEYLRGI
jgi:folate-dependent phosphoribosylglycinamide formyltransferase PurN